MRLQFGALRLVMEQTAAERQTTPHQLAVEYLDEAVNASEGHVSLIDMEDTFQRLGVHEQVPFVVATDEDSDLFLRVWLEKDSEAEAELENRLKRLLEMVGLA